MNFNSVKLDNDNEKWMVFWIFNLQIEDKASVNKFEVVLPENSAQTRVTKG